jgi:hypothetical protein
MLHSCRTQFRKEANAADNKGATVAVDSLINYEAVKVCQVLPHNTVPNLIVPASTALQQ